MNAKKAAMGKYASSAKVSALTSDVLGSPDGSRPAWSSMRTEIDTVPLLMKCEVAVLPLY